VQIFIDFANGHVSDDDQTVELNWHYSMPDGIHQFIVRRARDNFMIEIMKDKRVVQRGTVRQLGEFMGCKPTDSRQSQQYAVELDPGKPIFPVSGLINQLLLEGIRPHDISPMFVGGPYEHIARDATASLLIGGSNAKGERSAWAIRFHQGEIVRVYLWPQAANQAAAVLEAIRRIRTSSMLAPAGNA
jgi:hypothetical protein